MRVARFFIFLLVIFVIIAPNGIVGLVHTYLQRKPEDFVGRRQVEAEMPGRVP